ncbi:hypothetical protein B0H17DRAFT_1230987 [Mycena rosella]|uniref:F-box domain-containing protein n=1 Tax=Mycena rosella TaxID=1033263 RepID=A0AAD7D647_MYCRO|nr:hypothetical protein B0H17DRAFT_1230987 [Mycena rosella]
MDNGGTGGVIVVTASQLQRFGLLPLEILCMMFLHSFGCFLANARAYATTRDIMRSVCKDWRQLIEGMPDAWSGIYVSLESRISEMEHQFLNARRRKITVFLDFYDRQFVNTNEWIHSNALPLIEATFTRLAAASDHSPMRPEPTQGQSNLAVITSRRTTAIAKVVELKLQGSFPKWVHGQPYSGLSWLSLHMMRGSTSMAWAEVKALLPTANRLVALRLDQVECRGFPTTGEKLPTMQYLKKFTLNVSHASNARLARAIGMPAVISLTLSARQDKFIYHIIIGNLPAMKVITHLTLHILCTESTTLRSLLCKFPKVTHIDFSSNNVKMFELLATTVSRPLPKYFSLMRVCPNVVAVEAGKNGTSQSITKFTTQRNSAFFSSGARLYVDGKEAEGKESTDS